MKFRIVEHKVGDNKYYTIQQAREALKVLKRKKTPRKEFVDVIESEES